MTQNEEKTIARLVDTLNQIREENRKFREDLTKKVESLESRVEKKHAPIYLEQDILSSVTNSIELAIEKTLTGYNNPLGKLIESVVNENSSEIRSIISDSFQQVIRLDSFKESIVSAFSHKVARAVISNNNGLFDKVSNELKGDPVFKSKMVIAVSNVVNECLKGNEK